jgi:hypothetical protein
VGAQAELTFNLDRAIVDSDGDPNMGAYVDAVSDLTIRVGDIASTVLKASLFVYNDRLEPSGLVDRILIGGLPTNRGEALPDGWRYWTAGLEIRGFSSQVADWDFLSDDSMPFTFDSSQAPNPPPSSVRIMLCLLNPQGTVTVCPTLGQASGGWPVSESPEDLLTDLIGDVMNLNLQAGIGNALDSKLQNAIEGLDRAQAGDVASAIGMLYAFIQSAEAQRGKALTEEQADQLVASAQAIIDALSLP